MRLAGRVLAIGGSDCGGGAGIQADIKTITGLGAYASAAITAVTVQDTVAVRAVHAVPPAIVAAQLRCVLADLGADAIKTGMLVDAATIAAVRAALLEAACGAALVVDPVMAATSNDRLLAADGVAALRGLFGLAALITPNVPEAEALTGERIADLDGQRRAAAALRAQGAKAVLIKGGHLAGEHVTDLLVSDGGEACLAHPRIATRHTHGTGCTLAAAVAAGLAQGMALGDAVARACAYVHAAISTAPGLGAGHGPLNHALTVSAFRAA